MIRIMVTMISGLSGFNCAFQDAVDGLRSLRIFMMHNDER